MSTDPTSAAATFRLSPQQAFVLGLRPAAPVSQGLFDLAQSIDVETLRSRLNALVAEHEALRTTFVTPTGARAPVAQTVHDWLEPGWDVLRGDEYELGAESVPTALLAREASFLDAERGPTVRASVIEASGGVRALVLSVVGAAADSGSLVLMARALGAGSAAPGGQAGAAGSAEAVEAEPVQPADYAEWRHELASGDDPDAARGRALWASVLEGLRREPILFATPDGSAPAGTAGTVTVSVSDELGRRLEVRAAEAGVSVAVVAQAAWQALLHRVGGLDDVLTAELVADRGQDELADAIGTYEQIIPVRVALSPETRFAELVDRLGRARAEAARWRDVAFDGDLSGVAAVAVAGFSHGLDPWPAAARYLSAGPTGCPLELWVTRTGRDPGSGYELVLRYDPAVHPVADAEDLARGFEILLASALSDPSRPLSELPLLDEDGRRQLRALGAGGSPEAAPEAVHRRFARQAAQTPELVALAGPDGTYTFAALEAEANRLAHHLIALGVEPGQPVGLCLPRSSAAIVALLAIMKAGGGYLPLNLAHPPARLAHQISEAGAAVVVTESGLLDRLPSLTETALVSLDRDAEAIAARPDTDPAVPVEAEDLAYVMYTSGSTGLPKGVAVTHGNLAAYTDAIARRLGCDAGGRLGAEAGLQFALVSEISTDLGNTAVFPPLATGGCLHVIDNETSMDGTALAAYAAEHPIDVIKLTPTQVRALLAAGEDFLPRRWLVLGGEALSWELAEQLRRARPGMRLLNHYGPTETTVGCCTFEFEPGRPVPGAATVPIGRPLPGDRIYIVDGRLELVPVGVAGELCIGGAGVARGYVQRPEETAERFVADPEGGRMYRTGDRARFLRDGSVEFLGRLDHQLKIRGYRVEPGEVEAALLAHPAVREAAIVADDRGENDPRLIAYFVGDPEPSLEELQAFVARSLPEYMIPARWVPVSAFPLTPSGKIDRRALPDPDAAQPGRRGDFVAPRDELEQEIAIIWAQLLGVDEVGVTDDFFALGGHSLLATQAIMRIRRRYGNIPLGALFSSPTVAALAGVIRARNPS